jgi:uncharacterized protein involved in exopolysaccharide biosynthesis
MTTVHGAEMVMQARGYDDEGLREETSLFGFINILLKYRGMIALFVIVFGAVGLFKFFNALPTYSTRVGINLEANNKSRTEAASGIAAQLALAMASSGAAPEVQLFTEMLRSPPFLRAAAKGPYTVMTKQGPVTGQLAQFYGFKGPPEFHRDEMTDLLLEKVKVTGSTRTGNLWVTVEAPYPDLSQQIAANLISQVDQFSRRRKHSQAEAEREFIQARLGEARAELQSAENAVVQFRLNNRAYSSPELVMASSRLQRDVVMKQQLYTSLLQAYDHARIEEARNQPSITILEPPERPTTPERSSAASMPLLWAITGLLIAIMLAFIRERMAETAASPTPAFEHYKELRREALGDLKNPLRPVGRVLKPPAHG